MHHPREELHEGSNTGTRRRRVQVRVRGSLEGKDFVSRFRSDSECAIRSYLGSREATRVLVDKDVKH